MIDALGVLGLLLLACHAGAHVAVVASLARDKPARAAFALFFPPAGVVWAWEAGQKKRVIAYGATLVAFALVISIAALLR